MNNETKAFNVQLEIDVLVNGMREITMRYRRESNFNNIDEVIIPEGITNIADGAFRHCDSLKSVTIPDSVTSIGEHAFEECRKLKNVKIGNGVTRIERYTFDWCSSLTKVDIGDNVTYIGYDAFRRCDKLKSLTLRSDTKCGTTPFTGGLPFPNTTEIKLKYVA